MPFCLYKYQFLIKLFFSETKTAFRHHDVIFTNSMPLKIDIACSWDAIWVKKVKKFEDLYYHEVFSWFKTCKQSTDNVR